MDGRLRTCRLAALFLVLVLSATTRASALASTPAPAPLRIVPGQNEAAARCLGLILMSDKSVSQTQTDPRNLRIRAATFAIDMLGVLSSPGLRHSAGVLSFGSTAPASAAVGLRPLPDLTRELPTSLLAAPTLGGTDFPAAFARVEQLIRASLDRTVTRGCERRRFVVFVYSDLMPHSGSGGTDHQFREIGRAVRRLRDLGARIHVFAFSHHRRIDGLLRRWRDTGISSAVPVKALSDGGLERSYARVLAGELGLGEGGTARLSAASRRSSFVVPELSDRLIVVPFALSRTHVRLRSPSGEERDIHGIEAIHGPGAGRWSVTLLRGAATAVGTYAAPAAIRITRPARVVALGSDIRPEVTMATSTGAPIRATRSSVTVEATLSMAGQRPLHVELRDRGAGRFMATRAIDATGVGRLTRRRQRRRRLKRSAPGRGRRRGAPDPVPRVHRDGTARRTPAHGAPAATPRRACRGCPPGPRRVTRRGCGGRLGARLAATSSRCPSAGSAARASRRASRTTAGPIAATR